MDDYLAKPVDMAALFQKLKRVHSQKVAKILIK
jgi:YesN/AraC family two-component response regulator